MYSTADIARAVLKHLGATDERDGSHNQLTHGRRGDGLPEGWSLEPPPKDQPSTFSFGKKGEAFAPGFVNIPKEVKDITGEGASGKYLPDEGGDGPGQLQFDRAEDADDPLWSGVAGRQYPEAKSEPDAQETEKKPLLKRLARELTDLLGITEKGQKLPDWAKKKYPNLKRLGPIRVDFKEGHEMEKHLADLELLPEKLMDTIRIMGIKDIHLGPTSVVNLDGNGDLKSSPTDYRMKNRSWDDVGGVYAPSRKAVAVGEAALSKSGSASTVLHELGHFIGDSMGLIDRPAVDLVHRTLWDGLSPYFKGQKPGDPAGKSELIAETIAGIFTDEKETRRQVGDAFVDYLLDEMGLIDHKGRRIK